MAAWVVAAVLDLILIADKWDSLDAVEQKLQTAAVICIIAAGTAVIVLAVHYYVHVMGHLSASDKFILPGSVSSLIVGNAQASLLFSIILCVYISLKHLTAATSVSSGEPASGASGAALNDAVFDLAIGSIMSKVYGVATTLHNHRVNEMHA